MSDPWLKKPGHPVDRCDALDIEQAALHDRYGINRQALAARIKAWLG